MAKMDWLIEKHGINENKIAKTREIKGSIMIPTGGGKSGIMMENAINFIKENSIGRKYMFVFNGPILRIVAQTVNDFLSVLNSKEVCKDKIEKGEFMFFMNSSDSGESYEEALSESGISAYPFIGGKDRAGFEAFINSEIAKYAIVASCNKSLYKIDAKISEIQKSGVNVVVYLDESHTLTIYDNKGKSAESEEERTYVDFSKLCRAHCVYAFSATPEPEVTAEINKYNGHGGNSSFYIIRESPEQYITANYIVAPNVGIMRNVDGYALEGGVCEMFLNELKSKNPKIYHKILLTVSSWTEVESLEKQLDEMGYKVFSTCVKLGMRENCSEFTKDVIEFINRIDNYQGDCFVIHIKQLIAGIDIKSLTGCIIVNNQHGDSDNYRKYIQIIGRTLRVGSEDKRGMPIDERKKKYGYVLFVLPNSFDRENTISFFLNRYYGLDNLDFTKDAHPWRGKGDGSIEIIPFRNGTDPDEKETYPSFIKELLADIEKYIEYEIKPGYEFAKKHNLKWNAKDEIEHLAKEYSLSEQKELKNCNVADFLTNKWLIEQVEMLIRKYGLAA